jgi:hypothetical protein
MKFFAFILFWSITSANGCKSALKEDLINNLLSSGCLTSYLHSAKRPILYLIENESISKSLKITVPAVQVKIISGDSLTSNHIKNYIVINVVSIENGFIVKFEYPIEGLSGEAIYETSENILKQKKCTIIER